jgi:tetratricopeptide (TPR) repeat protein
MPNCIGWIHRELQDLEGAMKYDQQGLEVGREYHVLEAEANSLINLGIDYSHRGKNSETLAAFDEVHEIFGRDAWFRWRYNIRLQAATAEHWLSQGNLEKAREFALHLLEIATRYEAHKYVAVAHKLLAQVAIANNDLGEAEKEFEAGLEELRQFPAPLVEWKIYTDLGRLKLRLGDGSAAQAAFAQATQIVNAIADNTADAELKERFLNSEVVREVLNGAANTAVS